MLLAPGSITQMLFRLARAHRRVFEVDEEGKPKGPKEGKIEPSGPVLATMPNLIVVGSEPEAVADVILRAKGAKVKTPALSESNDFKAVAHLRGKKQLFGYANLKKVYRRTGAKSRPTVSRVTGRIV